MAETLAYRQDDSLKDLIDWETVLKQPRYAGGHDDQMQSLIKGATVLGHWNEGDYQGKVATAIRLPDGRAALYVDYYGSCSGCDSWEDAGDEDVRKLCTSLADSAYVFASPDEAIRWLTDVAAGVIEPDGYQWKDGVAQNLLEAIRQREKSA